MDIQKLLTRIVWGDTKGWVDPAYKQEKSCDQS